jgi:methyltransferase-like protein
VPFDLDKTNENGRVFYPSQPFAASHPDRLATLATLCGMEPAPVDRCRVLELGCADGGNIIPMAEMLPASEVVGIDVSAYETSAGREAIAALGLDNIRLETVDILDIDASFGRFDYVICHGVFSWAPDEIQDRIFAVCRQNLADDGVAYVNYNTYPGWHIQGMIRDTLRYPSVKNEDPKKRVHDARKMLDALLTSIPPQGGAYHGILKAELENLRERPDGFLYHAYLDVVNRPLYFHQFIQRAAAVGLQYLGDAQSCWRWSPPLAENVESSLSELAGNQVEREQLVDFVVQQSSRYSLLCHGEVDLHEQSAADSLKRMYVSAHVAHEATGLDSVGNVSAIFRTPTGRSIATSDPNLNAALTIMAEIWPLRLPFDELDSRVRSVVKESYAEDWHRGLPGCHQAGIVELNAIDAKYTTQVDERPCTTRYARRQAESGDFVTNLRHSLLRLNDMDRAVVGRLDGTNSHADLENIVTETMSQKPTSAASGGWRHDRENSPYRTAVCDSLARLAQNAMLIGGPPQRS